MRTRIGVGIDIKIEDQRGPSVLCDECVPRAPKSWWQHAISWAWSVTCWLGPAVVALICWLCPIAIAVVAVPFVVAVVVLAVVGFALLELLLLVMAGVGLVGRGFDHAGRAAMRNSRVIAASAGVIAQLPPPRQRAPEAIPAVASVRRP